MIEVKNLKKTYNVKGNITKALDDVSIQFPERGMVFLLGKSGSGKSTLLNVIGGLDKVDSGEIIIKGKSSSSFSGSDFDSYRNTFVGFIFQEYNILNEFSVEDNIALALELQGKKKDKEKVLELLKQVDLEGFAKRKPNTLSGGQKQRIAIARALIKNPEIIMADEPTGALDSNTGKQVFDTLKKLSKEKLIIVVSHDRDFAEIYGDRIIELADGKIISDMSKFHIEPKEISGNINVINDNVLSIKDVNELKRDDLDKIYDLLKSKQGEVIITSSDKNVKTIKEAIHISDDNKSEVFNNTEKVETKTYDPKNTKFIKSHLPFPKAFKIGASSLKTKPIRMIFTIILTVVALIMFGVTSTLMLYDQSYSVKEALKESDNDYEQINKTYKYESINHMYNLEDGSDEVTGTYASHDRTAFSNKDIEYLNSKSNNKYAGVIKFSYYWSSYAIQFNTLSPNGNYYQYRGVTGLVDAGEDYLRGNGFNIIAGTYPTKPDEIAISKYLFETFKNADSAINSYDDLINKKFETSFTTNGGSFNKKLKITAVIDFGQIPSKFDELKNENPSLSQKDLRDLKESFENYIKSSFHSLGYVSKDFYEYYKTNYNLSSSSSNKYVSTIYVRGLNVSNYRIDWDVTPDNGMQYISSKLVDKLGLTFTDLEGNKMSYVSPKEDEAYISYYDYQEYLSRVERNKYQKIYQMLDNNYIPETANLTNEEKDNIRNILNSGKYTNDDKQVLDTYLNYYNKYIKVSNAYNNEWDYLFEFELANPNWSSDEAISLKHSQIQELFNNFNNEISEKTFNYDTYLSQIEQLYSDGLLNKYLLYRMASDLYYSSNNKSSSTNMKDELETIITKERSQFTNDDYNTLKQILIANNIEIKNYDINVDNYNYNNKEDSTLGLYYKSSNGKSGQFKIIGIFTIDGNNNYSSYILNDDFINKNATLENTNYWYTEYKTEYKADDNAYYDSLIVKTNYTEEDIKLMLSDFGSYNYEMTNSTYQTLSIFIGMINQLKTIFLYVGLVVAVFAALMLFNFISSSISSKTKEIGILRAVGARGTDLFKIFFCESGVIAIICVILAVAGSIITCNSLNASLAENINLVLLKFGIINIGLIFAGALIISLIGTFIPVLIASKKQPVESIRKL